MIVILVVGLILPMVGYRILPLFEELRRIPPRRRLSIAARGVQRAAQSPERSNPPEQRRIARPRASAAAL